MRNQTRLTDTYTTLDSSKSEEEDSSCSSTLAFSSCAIVAINPLHQLRDLALIDITKNQSAYLIDTN